MAEVKTKQKQQQKEDEHKCEIKPKIEQSISYRKTFWKKKVQSKMK